MPYDWVKRPDEAPENSGASFHGDGGEPLALLRLWPHRSLPKKGFVLFIAATYVLFLLPLFAVLGTPALWGLLPFLLGTIALIWAFLQRSYRDGDIVEELRFWTDLVTLSHRARGKEPLSWQVNPFWMSVHLHKGDRPVRAYLTLRGAGREVELGRFLTPGERREIGRAHV